ncbi:heme biosynthesis protein HemY [Emcibacter sp.]|uniref:heme biosynthesis protein HemY n=1 Tax=Emcibacter sp. TaxID=1979954 RepID=UPI002AA83E15|nr:heme biosynthesis HemY N-terminal domain-containing protein [Emcibacter sp.]
MTRLTFYIILGVLVALGTAWMVAQPGDMVLTWRNWELRMSFATLTALGLLYTVFVWLLCRFWRALRNANPLNSPERQAARRRRGHGELDRGWSAWALGDKDGALRHARRARTDLPHENGPLLLLSHCETEKRRIAILEDLRAKPATAPFALYTLLEEAMEEEDYVLALSLARELSALAPGNRKILKKLFDIEVHHGKWEAAADTLRTARKNKVLEAPEIAHYEALLSYIRAVEADVSGQRANALDLALEAQKKDPGFAPAAQLAARILMSRKEGGRARKILETAWKGGPHPELASLFIELEPMESPTECLRRIQQLVKLNPDHRESLHLLAAQAIEAQHWPEARKALDRLVTSGRATARTFNLYARLEQKQKKDQIAAEKYMEKALGAKRDGHWHCSSCGHQPRHYTSNCPECDQFDGLEWVE